MSDYFRDYPDKTILIYKEDELVFTSEHKGVRPMLEFMRAFGPSEEPLTVVDRIMGRGAVMLSVLIGAKAIRTPIISETALDLAKVHGLEVVYEKAVPMIINRQGNGRCPIETAVIGIVDPMEGYEAIRKRIAELMKG